jgi:plastocyanin
MRRILLAALIALALCSCSNDPEKPGRADGASLDFTSKATIVIDDAGIRPDITTVRVGDAVTVTNRGTKDHGLTSKTVDTGTLQPGESTTVFLTATGTIDLRDRADSSHEARIEVAPTTESS